SNTKLPRRILLSAALGLALISLSVTNGRAQGLFAALTGVVADPSSAVVANAKVKLHDAFSGSDRVTETDKEGFFSFASVPVGKYVLSVEAPGFQAYKASDISLGGGEKRNVNVALQVGATTQTVEVSGDAAIVVPVDSGEKSTV